ncbi:MAG: hypothetical protein GYB65_21420 [Chloroflexi bacterium]|nr:hypothetical protein [Chloroflexota bacterium]
MTAYALITSDAVVVRTVAAIRSLEAVGALAESQVFVLCLDAESRAIVARTTPEHVVRPMTVDDDLPEVAEFSSRPISRFAVTCKPYLLRWILTQTEHKKALYFDSDIWFTGDPSFLMDELDENNVLLVPAMINPQVIIDDWAIFAKNAQRTGYYNAGFVGANQHAGGFLDWWANRCAYSTFRDFYQDISGDQKYLNWVPSLFDRVKIMRHYGLNIKPWNTRYFQLERGTDGTARMNGDDLVYFHFSQNMGNLLNWPEELYPEVSRYLDELEAARVACGQPYVDMPYRDNEDLRRPLLPREGKQAQLFKLLNSYRKPFQVAGKATRTAIARSAHLLPGAEERVARQYLGGWDLDGDARFKAFDAVIARMPMPDLEAQMLFMGISRLAFFLAYQGYPVTVYDPFQGHFNPNLNRLFNLQWSAADDMRDFLGVRDQLTLHRQPVTEAINAPAPDTVFVSARRAPDELHEALSSLAHRPTLQRLVAVFHPDWPATYREAFRAFIQELLAGQTVTLDHLDDMDLYRLNERGEA